jgi:hypothetical protein
MRQHKKHLPVLAFLMLALFSFTMKTKTYTYIDGNNNTYVFNKYMVDYKPVKKEESSSGNYSGGEPKRVDIRVDQFKKLEEIIGLIRKDKANIIKDRMMGCGTLLVNNAVFYINMSSKNKALLESELQAVLGK